MEKEKKFMIIGVLILLITLVGAAGTYAWFTWSSANNTNLTMSIGTSSDVIFKNGNDISTNKLAPVFNYTDGEKTTFTITNKSTTSFSYRISLNITSIDNELKNKSLKYKLVSNNTIITEGNFSNIESNSKNTLYEGELSKGNISYIFYLYIDGNEENDLNMINKSLVGTITVAEATATYELTNEDGTSYTPSYSGSGTKAVRSNAALSKFKEVRVDGVTIDSSNYTLTEGSTIVTFKDSYLKTLSEGEHTLKIISNDGFAYGKIIIRKSGAQKITNLYNSSTKTTTTVNSITYNLASSVGLMNDRKGSMSTGIDDGNIRYYGANPNNYIYFNCSDYNNQSSSTCELWRIIGVFDGKVKIMRGSQIGKYSWDTSDSSTNSVNGVNEWSQADLMKLLNSGYDSESVGGSLYWNAKSGTCYNGQNNAKTSCNFTSTGLKNDTTRNLIAETTYYTRGHDDNSIYVDAMYYKERVSGTVITGVTPTRTLIWTGKVALAYSSDYGYAVDLSQCKQTLYDYNNSTCTANNWMNNILGTSSYGWLLTPDSGSANQAMYVTSSGYVDIDMDDYTSDAFGVVPVLSLTSKLGIGSGTGTSSSPYQLSVN